MNIILMRKLDYWLGIPLCFLFSLSGRISSFVIPPKRKKTGIDKVLFIKLSELGTIILSYPLLSKVRQDYPDAEIFFVTFEENREIFKFFNGLVSDSNVFTIRKDSILHFVSDSLRIILFMRSKRIEIAFDLDFFSRFSAIFLYMINADKRIGFYRYTFEGLYRGGLLTHKIQFNPLAHITRTYLSLGQSVKDNDKNTPELKEKIDSKDIVFPKHASRGEVKEKLLAKLSEYGITAGKETILLNAGESILPWREWPLENFVLLSKKLLEDGNANIVIIGTEGAEKKGNLILKEINDPRCASLAGHTTLEELMELFCIAGALVSNDCGLAHLAMLTSICEFIIFGPESPQVFSPLGPNSTVIYSGWPCSPCFSVFNHRNSACADNKCLKAIHPEEVYALIRRRISG